MKLVAHHFTSSVFTTIRCLLVLGASLSVHAASAEQPAAASGVLDDAGYGPLRSNAKISTADLAKAFPSSVIRIAKWSFDSETLGGFEVRRGNKLIAQIVSSEIQFFDPSLKTDRGITVGSSFAELKKAYPKIVCENRTLSVEGRGEDGYTDCSSEGTAVAFNIDLGSTPRAVHDCTPTGPACCELNGACNANALSSAKVSRLKLHLEAK